MSLLAGDERQYLHLDTSEEPCWEPPTPLQEFDLPVFPVDIFPGWLREFTEALITATQTPPDLAGMLILAVCAAGLARKFEIRLRDGWQEPVNLFTLVALPPGERKSAVFAEVIRPLEEYEAAETERLSPEIAETRGKQKILEERLESAQKKAAKVDGETAESIELEASYLARELDGFKVPVPPRYLADDASPEKIGSLLAEQNGRLAILSPEGGIFDILAGRYSQNSGGNFEVFLKAHAGDTLRVDRIGRPPEHVKKPALTVGLAVQPDVLNGLMDKPGFRGRGLLARFHYAVPKSMVGARNTNPTPIPQYIRDTFNLGILGILGSQPAIDEDGKPTPNILGLSLEAGTLSNGFAEWLEPQLGMFGDLSCIADWAAKLHGGIARVAAILHVASNAGFPREWDKPIGRDTFDAAIRYGKYLIPHAKAAFADMGSDGKLNNAIYLLKWIRKQEQSELKKQEVWQGVRGKFQKVEPLDDALQVLIDYGYIRIKEEPDREGRGRKKAPTFEINPST